jgi:hypothetical protein
LPRGRVAACIARRQETNDGNPRTFGPAPDIGAFEIGDKIFKDGFQ